MAIIPDFYIYIAGPAFVCPDVQLADITVFAHFKIPVFNQYVDMHLCMEEKIFIARDNVLFSKLGIASSVKKENCEILFLIALNSYSLSYQCRFQWSGQVRLFCNNQFRLVLGPVCEMSNHYITR